MKIMTRPAALERVKALSKDEKLVAWGLAWGWTEQDISGCMDIPVEEVCSHTMALMFKLKVEKHGIGMVMVLAEGVRVPDLADFPGVYIEPVYPEQNASKP